jgi:3-hydroxyisobutyryl-CoA hydrolase
VSALLIRKDGKPQWEYKDLQAFDRAQKSLGTDLVDPFFETEGQPLALLTDGDYRTYPFVYGLPQESAVQALVEQNTLSTKQVIDHFVQKTRGKQGVHEVLTDIIDRKTYASNGKVIWGQQPSRVADA